MPNRHGITALVIGAISVVVGRVFGLIELYVLGVGLWLAVLVAVLSTRRPLPPMQVARATQPTIVSVGEPARVDIQLRNRGRRRSPHLDLWEPVGARGGAPMQMAPVRPGDSVRAAYRVPTTKRGVIGLGPLRARHSDVLGLCTRTVSLAGADEILVVPRVVPLAMAKVGSAGRLGQHLKAKSWAAGGREFHSLREYSDGDDPRAISWKASARSTNLIVRESAPEGLARCTVIVDTTAEQYTGDSWELAASAAASIVATADRAGLTTRMVCGPVDVRGPDVTALALKSLARAEPTGGEFALPSGSGSLDGLGLTVLVTGHQHSAATSSLRGSARSDETLIVVACTAAPHGSFTVDGTSPDALAATWNRMAIGAAA
jgi:uncharacterized protein (DUF58 family)